MKKLTKYMLSCLLMLTLVGCSTQTEPEVSPAATETITLNFTIKDLSKEAEIVLYEGPVVVSAECETLADVLLEVEEFNVKTEEGAYGLTLLAMMDVEGDWEKGPWWLYESDNNTSCVNAGYCDGISTLEIEDNDNFTFKLTSEY